MTRSLYNSPGVNINSLLHDAHPEGSVDIIDSPTHEGVVEDSIEAQMKAIKMVYKQPIAKVVASLAEQLESLGALDMSESVDTLGFDFYHESVLEINKFALPLKFDPSWEKAHSGADNIPLPEPGFFSKTPELAKDVAKPVGEAAKDLAERGAVAPSRMSALSNVLKYTVGPAGARIGGGLTVTELAGAGSGAGAVSAAGVGTIAVGVVAAAAVGVGVGLLLNNLITPFIGYLQSLFDDTPYAAAIQNVEDNISKINEKTSLEETDKLLRRAKNQCLVILKAPDVEGEEREAVSHMLERIQKLDNVLAEATKKFINEQKADPGKSNMGLLSRQYADTKKRIDKMQAKAEQLSTVSADERKTELAVNKIFAPNVEKIQQFKRIYLAIAKHNQDGTEFQDKVKVIAVQINDDVNRTIDIMESALDALEL